MSTDRDPPALCDDCGQDTTPCTHKRGCRHMGRWEWYMVNDDVWKSAQGEHFLCISCLERRIGRALEPEDFKDVPLTEVHPWDTPLLAQRKAAM